MLRRTGAGLLLVLWAQGDLALAQARVSDAEIRVAFSQRALSVEPMPVSTGPEEFWAGGRYQQIRHRVGLVRGTWHARGGRLCVTVYGATRCRVILKDRNGYRIQPAEASIAVKIASGPDPRNHSPQAAAARVCPRRKAFTRGARPSSSGWPPPAAMSLQRTRALFVGRSLSFGPYHREATELRPDGTTYRYATNYGVPCRQYGVYRLHPGFICLDSGDGGEVCFSVLSRAGEVALRREPASYPIKLTPAGKP